MSKKIFKYENKNTKLLRVKDLLMLFGIFTICIISIIYAGTKANEKSASDNVTVASGEAESLKSDAVIASDNSVSPVVKSDGGEIKAEPANNKFGVPVDGAVIKPYSRHELIYSETLDDWRIHNGIDIECPLGTEVFSIGQGVVKSINYDINLGNVVTVISDDFELTYASLSADVAVKENQTLEKGSLIGKVSDSCMMEICDETHIHFEMKKNGEYVDPLEYIHFD